MIVTTELSKTFSEGGTRRTVLRKVNAEIHRGEFVAIQGRSGSGKSTFLNLLAGLDTPDDGEIRVDNQSLARMSDTERTLFRRHHIGFVFQFFNLVPTLNVIENLEFVLELNRREPDLRRRRGAELLRLIGLEDRAHSFPDQLSGGEQQRVAIARAVSHLPAIVLADEPTGNLDADTEGQVLELLQSLPARHGITLLIATHSNELAQRADRILQLNDGALIEL